MTTTNNQPTRMSATPEQMASICARAYDHLTREIELRGVVLSHDQADEIGDEGLDWIATRLHLTVTETDAGVVCSVDSDEVA